MTYTASIERSEDQHARHKTNNQVATGTPTQAQFRMDRLGGAVVIGAALIMFIGAAIPFFAPSLSQAPWSDDPQLRVAAIAGNPTAYIWANGLILAATLLTALGFVPLSIAFQERARPWALAALVGFFFAAVFQVLNRIIRIQISVWSALQSIDQTDTALQAFTLFQTGLGHLFMVLSFLALSLYGIALLQHPSATWLGWPFVVGGVFGIYLHVIGGTIPGMVFLGTGALGVVVLFLHSPHTPDDMEADP